LNEIITQINNAFYRLECFMNGTIKEYQHFDFLLSFTNLFAEVKKSENFTYENCKLIGKYWSITEQIRVDFDNSDFENQDAYDNDDFNKDCEDICFLNYERIDDFSEFTTPDEVAEIETKSSITEIIQELRAGKQQQKQQNKQQKQQQNTYQWLTNPDKELPELYNRMIKGKIISQIDFPAFRSIFTDQPVQSIATKIQWLADGVLLAYFIDSIRNKLPMATDVWSVAKHCFNNAGSLKQSRENYQNNKTGNNKTGKPKQHKLIDDLLKDL